MKVHLRKRVGTHCPRRVIIQKKDLRVDWDLPTHCLHLMAGLE